MATDNEASRPLVASREDSGVSDMLRQISRDSGSMGVGSVTDAEPEFRAQRFDSHGALRLDVDGHGLDDTVGDKSSWAWRGWWCMQWVAVGCMPQSCAVLM